MGKLWRVDKALENSEGLRWVRGRLEGAYDWSKLDWVTVRRGRSEAYAFRGVCKSPRKGRGYRINCNVSKHAPYPIAQFMRLPPLVPRPRRDVAGSPRRARVGRHYAATRDGKSVQWRRLYRPLELRSEDEVLVFLWPTRPSTTSARRGRWQDGMAR